MQFVWNFRIICNVHTDSTGVPSYSQLIDAARDNSYQNAIAEPSTSNTSVPLDSSTVVLESDTTPIEIISEKSITQKCINDTQQYVSYLSLIYLKWISLQKYHQ